MLCPSLQAGYPELRPGFAAWLVQIIRFIILMAQAVPISLYVSLETVKVVQCKVTQGEGVLGRREAQGGNRGQ